MPSAPAETHTYFSVFVFLVGIAVGLMLLQPQTVIDAPGTRQVVQEQRTVVIKSNASSPLPAIFNTTQHSVVSVQAQSASGELAQGAQGSGFVYDTKGHIVTNEHVIQDADEVEVQFTSGTVLPATVVGSDPYSDLAVLKVDPARVQELNPLPLGDADTVTVGEQVAAIGNPFGLDGSMTAGIVSQKNRLLRTQGDFSIPNVIQTDAAINPGNSGGPLLDMSGAVIGINTAIQSRTRTFAGIGFAVSVETIKRVVPVLIRDGEYHHPWIGISGIDVTPEISDRMNLNVTHGFLILEVVPDSPADRAGLRGGDREVVVDGQPLQLGGDVIVGIDGKKMRKIDDVLNYLARETSVGDTVTVNVIRDGDRVDVPLTLGERPRPG